MSSAKQSGVNLGAAKKMFSGILWYGSQDPFNYGTHKMCGTFLQPVPAGWFPSAHPPKRLGRPKRPEIDRSNTNMSRWGSNRGKGLCVII